MCSKRKSKISVWLNWVCRGLKAPKKTPEFKKSSYRKETQARWALRKSEVFGPGTPYVYTQWGCSNQESKSRFSSPVESQITSPWQQRVYRIPWWNPAVSSNLSPWPFTCSQICSFMDFFPLYSLQPQELDSIFQNVIQHFSNTRGSTNTSWHLAHARTSGIPSCLGDGQMPVHVAKLWFGRVDPFFSVTLPESPTFFLPHQNLSS